MAKDKSKKQEDKEKLETAEVQDVVAGHRSL